jgi:hypothetical protein
MDFEALHHVAISITLVWLAVIRPIIWNRVAQVMAQAVNPNA